MSQVRYFRVGIVSLLAVILAVLVRYIAAQGLRKQGSMSRRLNLLCSLKFLFCSARRRFFYCKPNSNH